MNDPQTVATTDAGASPQTEDKGAPDPSIDELLEQFKSTETPPEQQPTDLKADDIREVVSFVKEDRAERIRERTDADVLEAAKVVKGDLDLKDDVVVDLLYGRANRDPRFLKAFQMRRENPTGWDSVLKAAGRELASDMSKPDQNLTDDHAAVEAAVQSASTGSPTDAQPDFNSMTDAEFNEWQRKNIK